MITDIVNTGSIRNFNLPSSDDVDLNVQHNKLSEDIRHAIEPGCDVDAAIKDLRLKMLPADLFKVDNFQDLDAFKNTLKFASIKKLVIVTLSSEGSVEDVTSITSSQKASSAAEWNITTDFCPSAPLKVADLEGLQQKIVKAPESVAAQIDTEAKLPANETTKRKTAEELFSFKQLADYEEQFNLQTKTTGSHFDMCSKFLASLNTYYTHYTSLGPRPYVVPFLCRGTTGGLTKISADNLIKYCKSWESQKLDAKELRILIYLYKKAYTKFTEALKRTVFRDDMKRVWKEIRDQHEIMSTRLDELKGTSTASEIPHSAVGSAAVTKTGENLHTLKELFEWERCFNLDDKYYESDFMLAKEFFKCLRDFHENTVGPVDVGELEEGFGGGLKTDCADFLIGWMKDNLNPERFDARQLEILQYLYGKAMSKFENVAVNRNWRTDNMSAVWNQIQIQFDAVESQIKEKEKLKKKEINKGVTVVVRDEPARL